MEDRTAMSNTELLALVIFDLGGDLSPIDTEDIAVRAHAIAPGRFGLRKYPEHVDIERVRKRLSDGKKEVDGTALLAGSFRKGWHLTPDGVRWAAQNADHLTAEDREASDLETDRKRKVEMTRFMTTQAWRKFSSGENVSRREADAVFRLTPYVPPERRALIIDSTRNLFLNDPEWGPFIEAMAAIAEDAK